MLSCNACGALQAGGFFQIYQHNKWNAKKKKQAEEAAARQAQQQQEDALAAR